jgi:hypothetical protein
MKRKIYLLLILILLLPMILEAGITGKIVGRVIDAETGDPLIGANVIVEGTSLGAAADVDGYYMILNVRPGTYSIRAMMIGYQDFVVQNVKVLIDINTDVDFTMVMTTLLGREVVVIAQEPAVRMDVTSTTFSIGSDQIEQLQIEEFDDLLNLQAGVNEGHFRGGRSNEVMYIIDGIPMNDVYSGEASFEIDNDMIEQVEVISGTFNAEYGQAMSGIINVVTKEGQANVEGNASFYMGSYLSNKKDIYLNLDKPLPTSNQNIKLSLSGPVFRLGDKLTYFLLGRYYKNDGWIYGRQTFLPTDFSNFSDPDNPVINASGDGEFVPMNPDLEITLNGK